MKKKSTDSQVETPELDETKIQDPVDDTPKKEEVPSEELKKETPELDEQGFAKPTKMVDQVLKLHPQYEELYVNDKGFAFTKDTSKIMRGNATLYKNKYFKK